MCYIRNLIGHKFMNITYLYLRCLLPFVITFMRRCMHVCVDGYICRLHDSITIHLPCTGERNFSYCMKRNMFKVKLKHFENICKTTVYTCLFLLSTVVHTFLFLPPQSYSKSTNLYDGTLLPSAYRFYSSATNAAMVDTCCSGLCTGVILCCYHHHCWDYHSEEKAVE